MAEHIVEIQIMRFTSENGTQMNEVGVVVPAHLTGLADTDTIIFRNKTSPNEQQVSIWFPETFFSDGVNTMVLPKDGDEVSRTLDAEAASGPRELRYQVYCHGIREMAIGDSPPKMDVPPPPGP